MTYILYILLVAAALFILLLLLPVKIAVRAAGGTDTGFDAAGRIMVYGGFVGGGMWYGNHVSMVSLYIGHRKVIEYNITRIVEYFQTKSAGKKPQEPVGKKAEEEKPEKPLSERLRSLSNNFRTYSPYFWEGYHIIRQIVRFDHVSADITLGLWNPAVTGWVTGVLFTLNGILPEKYVIRPKYDFTRRVASGDVSVRLTFVSWLFWKNLITHIPDIIEIVRARKKQDATLVTQEA